MEPMHIDDFYDADERRRESAEFELGDDWTDSSGNLYELSFVEATGELYLKAEPEPVVATDLFGDFYVSDEALEGLSVVVLAHFDSIDQVDHALDGWEDIVSEENSLAWLYAKLKA